MTNDYRHVCQCCGMAWSDPNPFGIVCPGCRIPIAQPQDGITTQVYAVCPDCPAKDLRIAALESDLAACQEDLADARKRIDRDQIRFDALGEKLQRVTEERDKAKRKHRAAFDMLAWICTIMPCPRCGTDKGPEPEYHKPDCALAASLGE